jgi:hypothetical protein
MFGMKKKGPSQEFAHTDGCRILHADPGVKIPWSEEERGHWVARCVCGEEHYREPAAPRVRLDPLDSTTSHHAGQCEFAGVTDPAVLKVLLKVREGAGGGYWWVECGSCEIAWQVPYYAESVG